MHQGFYFAAFAVVAALALAAAKWLDDGERRRARSEARGRSSFPPRMSAPGDARAAGRSSAPPNEDGRSSGH